jgi:hypothetical protein
MPTNVSQGSSVEFTVVFFDSSGNTTVPSSGNLTIVYTSVAGSTASTTIGLVQSGSYWIGNWDSTNAALGFANWSVTAPGLANNPAESGQLRIISP